MGLIDAHSTGQNIENRFSEFEFSVDMLSPFEVDDLGSVVAMVASCCCLGDKY
jgi:hypothetical protein